MSTRSGSSTMLRSQERSEMEQPDSSAILYLRERNEMERLANERPGDGETQTSKMSNFYIIASGYLLFTLTDAALKMVILLELYNRKFNALEISFMFSLYELLGVFTNLIGGIMGSKWGIKLCLVSGLVFQCIGISILCGLQQHWAKTFTIAYVALGQGCSGIAKDLVKVSGKSVTKLVTKDGDGAQSSLFKLVAWLTGAKNSTKGIGFFFGALMISYVNYVITLGVLLAMNFIIILPAMFLLEKKIGASKIRRAVTLSEIFNKGKNITMLSLARVFLFGSRDLWFEVSVPVFLRGILGFSYILTGTFIAIWVIVYGAVQSMTPKYILKPLGSFPLKSGKVIVPWSALLIIITSLLALGLTLTSPESNKTTVTAILISGLFLFGIVFAINSSIHSFLIIAYCGRDRIAMNVGFYYMSNAVGRLVGLLSGGFVYWYLGLASCLWVSTGFLIVCTVVSFSLGEVPPGD